MASNATVATVASFSRFALRQNRLKLLVGARPKPGTSGQLGPKWWRRFAPYFSCATAPVPWISPARCNRVNNQYWPWRPALPAYRFWPCDTLNKALSFGQTVCGFPL